MGKRIISFLMAAAIMIGMIPTVSIKADAASTYVIGNGVTIPNGDVPADGTNKYCKCGIEIGSKGHWCCWWYGYYVYYYVWGVYPNRNNDNTHYLRNVPASDRTLTAANLKKYLENAAPGALLRIDKSSTASAGDSNGHTLVFVEMGTSGNSAVFLEGNYDGKGRSRLYEWSFDDLISVYGPGTSHDYQYIKYISWPNAPEYVSSENAFTVSFDANGGVGAPESVTQQQGSAVTISDVIPTRIGYTFVGWGTSPSATSASYFPNDTVTEATTLYAVWETAGSFEDVGSGNYTAASSIDFSHKECVFRFAPSKSGCYGFASDSDKDTQIEVYDSEWNLMASDDDGGEGRNFYLFYYFDACDPNSSDVYYVLTRFSGDDVGSFNTTVTRRTVYISCDPEDREVNVGDGAEFSVESWGTGLTYQWYYMVPGETEWRKCSETSATASTLHVNATANKSGYRYYCAVFDDLGWSEGSSPATLIVHGEQWIKENGSWYYYREGVKLTGWQKLNGKWYYMNATGAMVTGWHKISGKWYYMSATGAMVTGWQKIDGKWYYMSATGAMVTGWQKIDGKWYYMSATGAMQTGWQKIDGKWYYMSATGAMQTGWQKIDGKWYHMSATGAMVTGWQKIDGKWYYMSVTGAMVTGTHEIDGKTYTFGINGAWIP